MSEETTKTEDESVEKVAEQVKAEFQVMVDKRVAEELEKFRKTLPVYKAMKEEETQPEETMKAVEGEIAKYAFGIAEENVEKMMPESSPLGTVYYGGIDTPSIDKRKDAGFTFKQAYEDCKKYTYTQTGGAGTAGYAMIPIYVDPRITDTTRKYTPIVELTPRVANLGTTADYNQLTA